MTDRVHALTVILDKEYREDDVQHIVDAIKMTKGVLDVQEHITNPDVYYAQETAKNDLRSQILEILKPDWAKKK